MHKNYPSYDVDCIVPPTSFAEAIDQIYCAALPDIVAYDGDPDYQQRLIWCSAAWLLMQTDHPLTPETAILEYLAHDKEWPA